MSNTLHHIAQRLFAAIHQLDKKLCIAHLLACIDVGLFLRTTQLASFSGKFAHGIFVGTAHTQIGRIAVVQTDLYVTVFIYAQVEVGYHRWSDL